MSLEDKLDEIARRKRERIQEALKAAGGKLRLASELDGSRARAETRTLPITCVLPHFERVEIGEGTVYRGIAEVPVSPTDEATHERGYWFRVLREEALEKTQCIGRLFQALIQGESEDEVALPRIAFLDTETTGLAGGAGTMAFLVGLGYFRLNDDSFLGATFVCEQFFVEDYCHEPALLKVLQERLADFQALVTYNGAGYDLPLLESRGILNRVRLGLGAKAHLDLLPVVRRLFKPRIGSCSLRNVEACVLGIQREHDIPGSMIPQVYFDHLRGVGRERLALVVDHNVQDIVSLGALLLHIADAFHAPEHPHLASAAESVALARLAVKAGDLPLAVQHYERALATEWPSVEPEEGKARRYPERIQVVREFVRCYRRLRQPHLAARVLETECTTGGGHVPELFVEWAKVAERELRDLELGLQVIDRALRQYEFLRGIHLLTGAFGVRWCAAVEMLHQRRSRILQRLGML